MAGNIFVFLRFRVRHVLVLQRTLIVVLSARLQQSAGRTMAWVEDG